MRISELDGLRVGIWGAGREGLASLDALAAHVPAAKPIVHTDKELEAEDAERIAAAHPGVELLSGEEGLAALAGCETIIRSPGVSIYKAELVALKEKGIRFTTGTNLWFAEPRDEPVVAVTGTKGKSTTSSLIAHLAQAAGRPAVLMGNVGHPLIAQIGREERPALWVMEASSFQTADLETGPDVAVLLNLYREHLDWHETGERYVADKLRLFTAPPGPVAVLNAADETTRDRRGEIEAAVKGVREFGGPEGFHVRDGAIHRGEELVYDPSHGNLRGAHNLLNACGALTALDALGIKVPDLQGAIDSFESLPHRLQLLGEDDRGRTWVNDSISTTPESAIAGIGTFTDRPVTLIIGGYDRGQNYDRLVSAIDAAQQIHTVVALPGTGERIATALQRDAERTHSMAEAVAKARELAPDGGVILLSPAAPSYNLYKNFEERGKDFIQLSGISSSDARALP